MIPMYDDISLDLIPHDAVAVAGYVNGRWPTYRETLRRWPHAHHLSVAVTAHADAECLDVEPGDAINIDAPWWVRKQIRRGVHRPVLYTSLSNVAALLHVLERAGIGRHAVRIWSAHYTLRPHLCDATCGFGMPTAADATQWTDRAHGTSLDQSICATGFFATPPPPPHSPRHGNIHPHV